MFRSRGRGLAGSPWFLSSWRWRLVIVLEAAALISLWEGRGLVCARIGTFGLLNEARTTKAATRFAMQPVATVSSAINLYQATGDA